MGKEKKLKGFLITCAMALGILAIFYGDVMVNPNGYFLGAEAGDALKNYYTPYYYVNHDDGNWWFDGMYYPYGEHVFFTDNQPVISAAVRFFDANIIPIGKNITGIINWLMLLSIVACAGFVFLLLHKFELPFIYSIALAVIIAFLSPQIDRFSAHYSLSYACFIPLVWLLAIKSMEKVKSVWLPLLGVSILFFSFIHMYYLAIGGLFLLAYVVFFGLKERFEKKWLLSRLVPVTLMMILVVLAVYTTISVTDPITDRPDKPWGHLTYKASLVSVFLPHQGPVLEVLNKVFSIPTVNPEAYGYVGFASIIAVLIFLVYYFRRSWQGKGIKMKETVPSHLQAGLFAGAIALIYSFSILYWWGVPEFLVPLHQIRSTGRFAWAFYYPFCVFGAWALYHIYNHFRKRGKNSLAVGLLFILLTLWTFESFVNINETHFRKTALAETWPNEGKQEFYNLLEENDMKIEDFQALIGFPFFAYGSERIRQLQEHIISVALLRASAFTGLPMVNGMLSRTSFKTSKNLIQLTGNSLLPKPALKNFPNDKQLLLIVADYKLKSAELELIKRADKIGEWMGRGVYKLPLNRMIQAHLECAIFDEQNASEDFIFHSFDSLSAPNTMTGRGALAVDNEVLLFHENLNFQSDELEFSAWMYADSATYRWPVLNVQLLNADGQHLAHRQFLSRNAVDIWGNWFRLSIGIEKPTAATQAKVWLDGGSATIDNFMIRGLKDTALVGLLNGKCLVNNYPLFKPVD